jgi:hypothetical protein
VRGDNPNNEFTPGAEAQLDLEYIMGLAPAARTTFYSFADRNPYSYKNEGFLAFLFSIGGERNPPSVLSLSYGDLEASVFNSSKRGAFEYGRRCDIEFLKLGLRGVTVLFSSGDDGVGNTVMRKDKTLGCAHTWPGWPASSPYVTAVGATQLSGFASPLCGSLYAPWLQGNTEQTQLVVHCSQVAETVCSATNGCAITSGGGFSEVYSREDYAPWQHSVVNAYLDRPSFIFSYNPTNPALRYEEGVEEASGSRLLREYTEMSGASSSRSSYRTSSAQEGTQEDPADAPVLGRGRRPGPMVFNELGRAFPDISALGSNFYVHLNGRCVILRSSIKCYSILLLLREKAVITNTITNPSHSVRRIIRESGTSASAPVVAAMVTLWNDMRLAQGVSVCSCFRVSIYLYVVIQL